MESKTSFSSYQLEIWKLALPLSRVHLSVEEKSVPFSFTSGLLARMLATFCRMCSWTGQKRASHACMHMPNIRGHYYLWPAGVKFSISIPISISHSIGWGKNAPFKLALNPNAHAHVPLRIDFYAPSPLSIIKNSFGLLSWQTGPLRYATKMHIIKIHRQEVGNKARK